MKKRGLETGELLVVLALMLIIIVILTVFFTTDFWTKVFA